MIRVLIADDHTLVRTGFRMILENSPDMRVIGEASDGAQATAMASRVVTTGGNKSWSYATPASGRPTARHQAALIHTR